MQAIQNITLASRPRVGLLRLDGGGSEDGAQPFLPDLATAAGTCAIHLLAGPPGSRKSGLALQLALDRGLSGDRTLILLSEESPARVTERSHRMLAGSGGAAARRALAGVSLEIAPGDPHALRRHVEQMVLGPASRYRDIDLLVLDSIQGGSVSAGADAVACRAAADAAKALQAAGVATLLVGHVTKANAVRGPRSLEHAVDVVLHLDRRGGRRTLAVPKNSFGPAVLRPVPLMLDPVTTRLSFAPHADAAAPVATVRTFIPGIGLAELQAAASLPPSGGRGRLGLCRGVPRDEVLHAIECLGRVRGFETILRELNLSVACRLPGGGASSGRGEMTRAAALLHLPLCLALAGACLGRGVPDQDAAVGEADLAGRVRALPTEMLGELQAAVRAGECNEQRLLCPSVDTKFLPWNCGCELAGVATVESAVRRAWPDLDLDAMNWNY